MAEDVAVISARLNLDFETLPYRIK